MFKYSNKLLSKYIIYIKKQCNVKIPKEKAGSHLDSLSKLYSLFGKY